MNLFHALLAKLPPSRASLRMQLAEQTALAEQRSKHFCEIDNQLDAVKAELQHVKEKRNLLHRQIDELNATIQRQTGSVDVLMKQREIDAKLLNEQRLILAENHGREERFMRTIDTLNATLTQRNTELDDVRTDLQSRIDELQKDLTAAYAEITRHRRPVLFRRSPSMPPVEIAAILAGKATDCTVRAIEDLLDQCAVEAMSEAATAPTAPVLDGPNAMRGFTETDRTFSSGGVFALAEFKRRLAEALTPQQEERKAA
jgi:prefoldin subunit 5